jgi:hypothetical protein
MESIHWNPVEIHQDHAAYTLTLAAVEKPGYFMNFKKTYADIEKLAHTGITGSAFFKVLLSETASLGKPFAKG